MIYNRLIIKQYPQGVEAIISARRSLFVNLFLAAWMFGWGIGEVKIIVNLLSYEADKVDAFLVFWACGWTLSGLLVVFLWLWNMKGKEVIRVSDSELIRYREYVWFSRTRKYQTKHVANLRLTEINPSALEMGGGMEFWGLSGGTITFDYGQDIQKIGLGIDESEATQIIELIKCRFGRF